MTIKYEPNNDLPLYSWNLNYSINKFNELIKIRFKKQDRFAVCLLDISNFKYYNYRFGYEFGDILLEIIFSKVRQAIKNNGHVYRFGGDTLIILLSEVISKNELVTIIHNISDIFNNPVNVGEEKLRVLINIGISVYPEDSNEVGNILKFAEIALNYSKKCYLDKYKFFEHAMYEKIINNGKIEADIINAIKCNEFILYYQPQINIKNMTIYGVEALLRWNHPDQGVLAPSYFIEIVEKNGMINEIGKFVFQEACKQLAIWHKLGYSSLSMSINISEKQLEDISFLIFIEDVLKTTRVEAKHIRIEITERILINPTESIINILSVIRAKGIKVIIDDFGTKYSSLNYLYRFPIDGIKIDKSFVDNMLDSNKEVVILKNIVRLAHEINLDVVAEGIETKEQLNCIERVHCHNIQGYIFGQPVSSNDFENYLMKYKT